MGAGNTKTLTPYKMENQKHTPETYCVVGTKDGGKQHISILLDTGFTKPLLTLTAFGRRQINIFEVCDAMNERDQLKAQRDELLAALKFCQSVLKKNGIFDVSDRMAVDIATAAIGKAEGGSHE